MIDSPSGGAPEKAPRWDLMGIEGCGSGNRVSSCSRMFSGYVGIYIGGRSRSVELRGAHEGGGVPREGRRASLPRGLLIDFFTSTPSPLDHVCSQNHVPEGFSPFGLRLISFSFETLK